MRANKLNALILTLMLFCIFFSNSSHAGVFSPNSREKCLKQYSDKANSKRAALAVGTACKQLFDDPLSFKEFIFSNDVLTALSDDDLIALSESRFDDLSDKGLSLLSQKNKEAYKRYLDSVAKKKKWAKCVLNDKAFLKAKTDYLADSVYHYSKCAKIN